MIGFQASTSHDALRTARSLVAIAAHAIGVQPLDGPFVKFKDGYISFVVVVLFSLSIPLIDGNYFAAVRWRKKSLTSDCWGSPGSLPSILIKCKFCAAASGPPKLI
jgi:hypothetical protein